MESKGELPHPALGAHVYKGVTFSQNVSEATLEKVKEFKFLPSDVMIATYPRSGTTWMQEIVYLLFNNADLDKARLSPIIDRVPYLEYFDPKDGVRDSMDIISERPEPRLLKTHLMPEFLEPALTNGKPRIIHVMRNGRDVLASYYNQQKGVYDYKGTFSDFYEFFKRKALADGDWFDHAQSWVSYSQQNSETFFSTTYEEMKGDFEGFLTRLAAFVKINLTDDMKSKIINNTTFKSMRENPTTNYSFIGHWKTGDNPFIRKGQVGDWVNYFSEEQVSHFDEMMKYKIEHEDFPFKY